VFEALVRLYEKKGVEFDMVLLRDELKKGGHLADAGGPEYLMRLAESVPSAANATYYASIVREKQLMRHLIQAGSDIVDLGFEQTGEPAEKLDEAERKIFAVTQQKVTGNAVPLQNVLLTALENISLRKDARVTGLATGFCELNELTSGLQKGEIIIVAGRPSMGKTSLVLNVVEHIGADDNAPVAIFSMEMSKQQLAERILCSRSHIDTQKIRKGLWNDEEYHLLVDTGSELSEKPIYIDDSASLTPLELRAKARRLKSQYDIQCLMVDYLQLMSAGDGRVESRQQEITLISRYLKGLARELEIPVVVISQLNRAPEGREGHRPRMSDLRESGSIEQDADVVMLLHREDYYHAGESDYKKTNTAELIIAKQRNGPTGAVKLTFFEQYTRFEDYKYDADAGLSSVSAEVPF
jgi:replicative DNA helicase